MKKKIVVVTGASRGIGKAISIKFAQTQDYMVIGTATSEAGADNITNNLQQYSGVGKVLNISDSESVDLFIEQLAKEYGGIDILVNNAGITKDGLIIRMNKNDWEEVIDINLTGTFILSKAVLKSMMKKRWGRIINISSVVADTGNPGQTNYVASKSGIEGFTRALALEVASRNITVNSVAPGFIDTDMTDKLNQDQKSHILKNIPMQKIGEPDDIANAVFFLSQDSAKYITGIVLPVNGGLSM